MKPKHPYNPAHTCERCGNYTPDPSMPCHLCMYEGERLAGIALKVDQTDPCDPAPWGLIVSMVDTARLSVSNAASTLRYLRCNALYDGYYATDGIDRGVRVRPRKPFPVLEHYPDPEALHNARKEYRPPNWDAWQYHTSK